jgi:WD40 repeat protein
MALPNATSLAPSGQLFAAAADDGSVTIWELPSANIFRRMFISKQAELMSDSALKSLELGLPFSPNFDSRLRWVGFSPDERWIATLSDKRHVHVWNVESAEIHTHPFAERTVEWVGFTPNGMLALKVDNGIRFWNPEANTEIKPIPFSKNVDRAAFDPTGSRVAIAATDRSISIVTLSTANALVLRGQHQDKITGLAWDRNGMLLASSSWDGTVRVWDAESGHELLTLDEKTGKRWCVAFSPDGRTLASGGENISGAGNVLFWRSAIGAEGTRSEKNDQEARGPK